MSPIVQIKVTRELRSIHTYSFKRTLQLTDNYSIKILSCRGVKKFARVLIRSCVQQISLNESIRYRNNDAIEKWLTDLLCLDATSVQSISSGCPPPEASDLYYINR